MDYNQMITTEVVSVIDRIVRMVDRYSDYYKIKDVKIQVDDSDLSDLGNYVSTGTTCEFRIDVQYLLNDEEEYRYFYVTIPRMINGLFIINGKYKMLSRRIGEDYVCMRVGDYFRISYLFSYNINDRLFDLYDEELEDQIQLTFDELKVQYPDKLKLTEHQSNKLKIKLNLDEFPTHLTQEIVDKFETIVENPNDIINKRIISIESGVMKTLRNNMLDIVKSLNHNFYAKGTISPAPIQKIINGAFNGQLGDVNPLINSANVNPLSFDSTNQKIIIDNEEAPLLSPGNYDETMADIIDPVVTPDNANVNRINMLTKAATINDGYIGIKCYDSKFAPVEVEYTKYCASRVLLSSEVTSYAEKIVPRKEVYRIKLNRKIINSTDFDYIEPAPDDRLSIEARMIPMLNLVDSVRGAMGAKMIGQAVPLSDPDTPRVQSGHETDNELSTTDIKFESTIEGEVIKADNESVIVMVNGIPKEYKVPSPAVGIYDITAAFSPRVKAGDLVHTGETLITHEIAKTGSRNLGVNALVALRPYRGFNYEDGIIISKSFANKLSHYSIQDLTLFVNDKDSIVELLPIGTRVKSKDILVSCITRFKSEMTERMKNLLSPSDKSIIKMNNLVTPNNIEEGYVTDVKIYYDDYVSYPYGTPVNKLDEGSIKILEGFKRKKAVLPESIPAEYRAQLPKDFEYEGYAACIRYRILVKNPATVGTKISNRYGSKGLISIVLPDDQMDKTTDGRTIDVILNSDAVIARKNIAQIPEVFLSNIADIIKRKASEMTLKEAREFLAKYKLYQYSGLSDSQLKRVLTSDKPLDYITGSFSTITAKEILEWLDELKVDELTQIIDGKTKRPVRNKVLVGSMYMIKLYQLPEHYNKVFTPDSDDDPILGKGLLREGAGQSQGNLETYSLMASDLEPYIYETRKKHEFIDAENILINLRLAGVNVKAV
jgi:DNA-directed RNA polymerase beta subunit